jgi:hypothetical protein
MALLIASDLPSETEEVVSEIISCALTVHRALRGRYIVSFAAFWFNTD